MRSLTTARRLAWLATAMLLVTACGDGAADSDDAAASNPTPDEETTDATNSETNDAEADNSDAATDSSATEGEGRLTVYSGRAEELVAEVFTNFTEETGIEVDVRYGDTAELAATIVEEGEASPADVFFSQDAGALGALEAEGLLATLPDDILDLVAEQYRSESGAWTGTTGRARTLVYDPAVLDEAELPDSVMDLTDPAWAGRVAWAPTNGSFQAFVTAMRLTEGDDVARTWLEGMVANDPLVFENNTGIVEGVSRGEAEVGLVNHYYVYRLAAEDPDFTVVNAYLPGDIGGMLNVSGVGVVAASDNQDLAAEFVSFLLGEQTQTYFSQVTDAPEFPLREGVDAPEILPSLEEIAPPPVDLGEIDDLQGTLQLLQETGALQ